MMTEGRTAVEYLSCAQSAKLIRMALKQSFPGVKFSVRSEVYSGGASVTVKWTDGPRYDAVRSVAGMFSSASFDGMIDMEVGCDHWLNPDGTVSFAYSSGTQGSKGVIPGFMCAPRQPGARLVRLGSKYVSCVRELSVAFLDPIALDIAHRYGRIAPEVKDNGWGAYLHDCNDYDLQRVILTTAQETDA